MTSHKHIRGKKIRCKGLAIKLNVYNPIFKSDFEKPNKGYIPQDIPSKLHLINRVASIIESIKQAISDDSKISRIDELSSLIIQYPFLKYYAYKNDAYTILNQIWLKSSSRNLTSSVDQIFALLGCHKPLHNEGICILSIDGGGSRGLLSLHILKEIQKLCNQPIYTLFDFICGTSTGAFIASLVGLNRKTLDQCTDLYKELSADLFERNRLIGAGKLVWSHSYYDSDVLVKALKKQFLDKSMISTSKDLDSPKVALISTVVNTPLPKPFIFRNYDFPLNSESLYPGTYDATIWQACQASASAPGYFQACQYGPYILQDGGVLMNNPAPIAVHESKLIWPGERVQCIVSLGNGRFNPFDKPSSPDTYSSLKSKLSKMAQFIADTEGAHSILSDLLPYNYYYRLNPRLTKEFHLDEKNPDNLKIIEDDAAKYVERNAALFEKLGRRLMARRKFTSVARDAINRYKSKFLS
ncbi:unnamed protein product [Gordionus sp. m RMFG-2023]